jgi:hypothetical protein
MVSHNIESIEESVPLEEKIDIMNDDNDIYWDRYYFSMGHGS